MIEELSEEFGIDGGLEEIEIETEGLLQRYFIYIPDYDFDDNLLLLE